MSGSRKTRELRRREAERERAERAQIEDEETVEGKRKRTRRADKLAYLQEKLAERERSERE
jgi:hypothetical protein